MIARIKLAWKLRQRRTARRIESERASQAYWKAQREQHSRDPLWKAVGS